MHSFKQLQPVIIIASFLSTSSGTIMMSGCGILTNGKGTRREYCEFSLDELQVCDHSEK